MNRKLLLGGGGNEIDSQEIDNFYGELLGKNSRVLYIPIALGSDDYDSCLQWFRNSYKKYGFEIEMLLDLKNADYEYLKSFDSFYIGGGNTFSLLEDMKKSNFFDSLRKLIDLGKVVYGGSAGAIVLCKDISTAFLGKYPDVNNVGISDFSGLNVVNGYSVHCHYETEDCEEVKKFAVENNLDVFAIPENGGVYVNGNDIKMIGKVDIILKN